MRSMEAIALEVWEEEVTTLKQQVREGSVTLDEAQRRRAVIDEACVLFAQGRDQEAVFGVEGSRLNTPISGYFNRRFAYKRHADFMAGLPASARTETRDFPVQWPERWWVATSTMRRPPHRTLPTGTGRRPLQERPPRAVPETDEAPSRSRL